MRVTLAAEAEDGDLAGEQVDVAAVVDRCHCRLPFASCSLVVGELLGFGAPGRCARQPDPAGARELLDPVGAHELLERVDLLGRADDLEHDRVGADVGHAHAEHLGEREELGALRRRAATVISASSRSTAWPGSSSLTRRTLTSLCICFSICSSECCEQSTRRTMRETLRRSVGPTARLSML